MRRTDTFHTSTQPTPGLRYLRKQAGLSILGLSRRSGVARNTIRLLEQGESEARRRTREELAYALGVSPQRLLFEEEQLKAAEEQDAEDNARIAREAAELDPETVRREIMNDPILQRMVAAYLRGREQQKEAG